MVVNTTAVLLNESGGIIVNPGPENVYEEVPRVSPESGKVTGLKIMVPF